MAYNTFVYNKDRTTCKFGVYPHQHYKPLYLQTEKN